MPPYLEKAHDNSTELLLSPIEELNINFLDNNYWREWDKTGFKIKTQILKLAQDCQVKLSKGKSLSQTLSEWTQETAEDMEGFWFEYICQHLVLLIKIEKKFANGKWEIVAPRYSNKPLTETVLPKERNGALKEGIEKLTEFLTSAPRGSSAVLVSPAGWSGLETDTGEKIVYTETQIYIYKINVFGQIEALTIRVDNTLSQNTVLYSVLSGNQLPASIRLFSDRSAIEEIVRNPIFINGAESQVDFKDIIRTIEKVKGSKYALKERTFAELWEHFQNRQKIFQFEEQTSPQQENEKAKAIIENFRHFMESYEYLFPESLEEIAGELDNTLRQFYRIKTIPQVNWENNFVPFSETEKRKELTSIQSLFGCRGSSSLGIMSTAFGLKSFTVESGTKFYHCGACGKSGQFSESELIEGRPKCDKAIVSR